MTVTTEIDATNDMFSRFKTAWDTNAPSIVGYVPEVRWPYIAEQGVPARDRVWVRVWKANLKTVQTTLGKPALYTTTGTLYIQIFCPPDDRQTAISKQLGDVALKAYRGVSSGSPVWYHQVTLKEMLPEPLWFSRRLEAQYSFDELN